MVVSLDLIEMRDSETGKKRSMISLNLQPESEKTDDGNQIRKSQIQKLIKDNEGKFENTYSNLNENFINEIIDLESEK